MPYTYLLINFFTICIPLIFSFHPKINFYKTWYAFFPAVFLTGFCFIMWDIWFTQLGVWGFNPQYLTGIYIVNLPLEEILFFLCIPYACVFTFYCLSMYIKPGFARPLEKKITGLLIFLLIIAAVFSYERLYPFITFISLATILAIASYILDVSWLSEFYIVYAILLIPFFIVNGLLTGTGLEEPVVWYNDREITGLKILSIPVEDIFYGMVLILTNLLLYKPLNTYEF